MSANVNQIVDIINKKLEGRKFDSLPEKFAAEFQLENEGSFYVAIRDGKIDVAPFEYNDRDVLIKSSADTIKKILSGDMGVEKALITKKVSVSGDVAKAMFIKKLFK